MKDDLPKAAVKRNLYLGTPDRVDPPVHLDVVLPHEARLPGGVDKPSGDLAAPPAVPV